ncbi:hypothetical protein C0216_12815 [Streptomyces globosus]|uniref:DUF2180 family protein n=1 Tax=Streptomyces globosus TaxID=68209 RepID=A0A344TZZ8_9ACTN|nr:MULTISPECIES: DUF2180 family protein [Streptomyces]AXE24219.1 hypothetical protein C0216_12815 [Streptomyces globosus]
MNCYECAAGSGPPRVAVAVCRECGVGLCTGHARVETHELLRPAGLGKTTTDLPARRVVCPVCAAAEASVPGPV